MMKLITTRRKLGSQNEKYQKGSNSHLIYQEFYPGFGWDRVNFRKKLGGDTAGMSHPSWPRGFSIPCDVMLSI